MKKLFGTLILILLVGSLGACSNNNSNTMISAANVNEREETILSTITSESFLFDFNNTEYKEVAVWVEKYESGKLVDDQLGYMTTQVDKKGSIILATAKASDNEKQQTFHIGVGDQDGTSSASVLDKKPKDADAMSIVYSGLPEEKTLDGGEILLANIAYSNNEFGTSSISNQFYEDPEAHMDELNEYNVVYLFKAKFMK
ncbi:hypothetical protein J6TS1_31690 [Siminovitchia terrae]|uniref:Lipoprotein n=1 Tax=Siminovitchia terrae TaxID=1914933 RepID=A0A429XDX5_SIMTE|nr:hypothetical protein [Siminovitchia terrae]RST61552.1 hypothetical protein D5F11_001355 [Siminovitchia terrae]GIN90538.1 hypothetical protein J22TS1_15890 [Siminovitchia terrae]GIN97299.1 hypothetical protein J6TS1_31690 [Siminovitchia terrae]